MNFRVSSTIILLSSMASIAQGQGPNDIRNFIKPLKQVTSGGGGIMFGVTASGEIYGWNGREWNLLEGQLTQVSVGMKNGKPDLWGVNAVNNSVWRATETGWVRQPGAARYVAVSKDAETIVALDVNGKPFLWNGSGWAELPNPIVLKQVAIGKRDQIYGLNDAGQLFRWRANLSKWAPVKSKPFRSISVGLDGAVGGVDPNNIGLVRKGEEVEAELSGSTAAPTYYPVEMTVDTLEILDKSTQLAIDKRGMIGQIASRTDAVIPIDAKLVISTESFYEPEIKVVTGQQVTMPNIVNGCVYLTGSLKLDIAEVTATPSPSAPGQTVTFAYKPRSGGEVTFSDGPTKLGSATAVNGVATFSTTALTAGTHSITASVPATGGAPGYSSNTISHVVGTGLAGTSNSNPTSSASIVISPNLNCKVGTFGTIVPSNQVEVTNRAASSLMIYFQSREPVAPTPSQPTAPSEVSSAIAVAAQEVLKPPVCLPHVFLNMSAHSWVKFDLPAGIEGSGIRIPAGSYHTGTAPACYKVRWDDLVFACTSLTKAWSRIAGNWDANGECWSGPGSSPYVRVGTR
jgi:Tectonin domain/Bacterial Ig-like domain (group 3)